MFNVQEVAVVEILVMVMEVLEVMEVLVVEVVVATQVLVVPRQFVALLVLALEQPYFSQLVLPSIFLCSSYQQLLYPLQASLSG